MNITSIREGIGAILHLFPYFIGARYYVYITDNIRFWQ